MLSLGVVLTNSYRGKITSDVTAPMEATKLETVEQALKMGYKILLSAHEIQRFTQRDINAYRMQFKHRPGFFENDRTKLDFIKELAQHGNILMEAILKYREAFINQNQTWHLWPLLLKTIVFNISEQYLIVDEFLKCNKTILLAEEAELTKVEAQIQEVKHVVRVYKGKEKFMPRMTVWHFGLMHWDRLNLFRNRFQSVIHSNVLEQVENTFHAKYLQILRGMKLAQQSLDDGFTAVNMQSNILVQSVTLYLIAITVCSIIMVTEVIRDCFCLQFYLNFTKSFYYS
jgi:hypothetical protein